ncbi:alanine:cation symporter family protein [Peribacillus simplex]|uniref:Alanine:cation symporter family protein n=2 Tax=Peribacillus TaxID=2675229 RepID=A0AA90PEN6_9BACI|nr:MULTISPECIES: alanine:cation symporter family protein [Peribacillus]MDP1421867.1 alanine:cation symporter family protein [Peribacillus simplex]MDP1454519.1 alanine:cation symporter family protein [Peribacillus frigoritolerans]
MAGGAIALTVGGPGAIFWMWFAALDDYIGQRKLGIDPIFYASSIPGLKGVECWEFDKQSSKITKQN